jgi:cell filamentation protein, protein adenylyltransferase
VKKSALHRSLRANAVAVPGRSGCYAVVPPKLQFLPLDSPLVPLARREMQVLGDAVAAAPGYAKLLLHMLNRREAVDSSQIEGTHTQFDELLLHEIEAGTKDAVANADADRTMNYLHAYAEAVKAIEERGKSALDLELILSLHKQLMRGDTQATPGRFRNVQNFIGGLKMEQARFIPPPATEVPPLMEDLVARIGYEPSEESATQIDILGRAAFIHAQFESIHPFVDGNGRVGRILIPLMLLAEGEPPLHLASFLKVRQREYYDALLEVQMRLQWAPWNQLFLECVIASCRHTVHLLAELSKLSDQWDQALKGKQIRKHAAVWQLSKLLLGQPVITVNAAARRLEVSFPAANAAIGVLVDLDILREHGKQNRSRAFQSHEVMNLLYTGIDAVLDDVATLRNYGHPDRKAR